MAALLADAARAGWRIRPARADDAAACGALAVRAWERVHQAYAAILGRELHDRLWPDWRARKAAEVAAHVRARPEDAAVAEAVEWLLAEGAAGAGVGVAGVRRPADTAGADHGPASGGLGGGERPSGGPPGGGSGPAAPIGFVTWHCDAARRVGEIGNNAVDPGWQGRGVGTALHRHALEVFRARGMEVARVATGLDEGHAPARRAYAKVGFAVGLPSITYYRWL